MTTTSCTLVDSARLRAGLTVVSKYRGRGIPASAIATGFPLPSLLENDIAAGDPAGTQYRVELTKPSAGKTTIYEDSSFSFTDAADGTYTGPAKVYKNSVLDNGSYSFQIGSVVTPPDDPGIDDAPRFGRPISDISKGAWTASTGTDLFSMIDEVTLDSTDYISADPMGGTPVSCELALGPITDPGTSSGQVVRYEAHSAGGTNLTVTLKQGATTIASRTHTSLPTTPTIHELVLTGQQCDAITNYRDLRLVFTVN